jgi:tRNA_anti-like
MSKIKKIILAVFLLGAISAVGVWYYVFVYSKNNHRTVESEKGIEITANQLVAEYTANEESANKKFLNKAIEVTGEVSNVQQDSLINVTLKSADAFANVYITLVANQPKPDSGKIVTIKGICTGKLSDVVLNEAIIIKK